MKRKDGLNLRQQGRASKRILFNNELVFIQHLIAILMKSKLNPYLENPNIYNLVL